MLRLFIGIKCNDQKYLNVIQSELKELLAKSKINWVDPANFHITLKFLGDVEDAMVNSLIAVLDDISKKFQQVTLVPDKLGIFGSKSQPRVIWFGFREEPLLSKLNHTIEKSFMQFGFAPEEKKFTPHLTLGRVKKIIELNNLEDYLSGPHQPVDQKFIANRFQLFNSALTHEGPEYQIIKEFRPGNKI
jgi:2'-5' RNA ligase